MRPGFNGAAIFRPRKVRTLQDGSVDLVSFNGAAIFRPKVLGDARGDAKARASGRGSGGSQAKSSKRRASRPVLCRLCPLPQKVKGVFREVELVPQLHEVAFRVRAVPGLEAGRRLGARRNDGRELDDLAAEGRLVLVRLRRCVRAHRHKVRPSVGEAAASPARRAMRRRQDHGRSPCEAPPALRQRLGVPIVCFVRLACRHRLAFHRAV